MNTTQKQYYIYKHSLTMPDCIRIKYKPVSIHTVINSKVIVRTVRSTTHKELRQFNLKMINLHTLISVAVSRGNIKLLRILYKRYRSELFSFMDSIPQKIRDSDFHHYKGWLNDFNSWKITANQSLKGV